MAVDAGGNEGPGEGNQTEHRESVAGRISTLIAAFDAASPTLTLSQLTDRTGLPKSTVHRMADQLVEYRWLERTTSGYRLGIRFFEVGGLVSSRSHLRERALPFLQDLQAEAQHSVHLGILEGTDVVILEKLWGHGSPSLPTRVGGRQPAYCTAVGKAMLAFEDQASQASALANVVRRTEFTITEPRVMHATLESVRRTGVAYDREEAYLGLGCVAAPIRSRGRTVGAVSATGPVARTRANSLVGEVRDTALAIGSGQLATLSRPLAPVTCASPGRPRSR